MADDFLSQLSAAQAQDSGSAPPPSGDFLSQLDAAQAQDASGATSSTPTPMPGPLANSPDDSLLTGAAKGAATGAIKGAGDVVGAVGNIGNFSDYLLARLESGITGKPLEQVQQEHQAARAVYEQNATPIGKFASSIDPTNVLPDSADVSNPILKQTGSYEPTTPYGRAAQAGVEAVTGSLGPGVIGAGARGATRLAPLVRALSPTNAATVASLGGLSQATTEATGDPLLGMAAAAAPGVVAGGIGRGLQSIPGRIDPATAALADTARNTYGIPITAPQMSSSTAMRFLNSALERMPMSGAGKDQGAVQQAFNRAVSNTFGEDATSITPQVMATARDRIGAQFDSVAARTPQISIDPQFGHELTQTLIDAQQTLTPQELTPLHNQVSNVLAKVDPSTYSISGDTYQSLTRRGAPLDRAMQSPNPNLKFYAGQIRDALDGALERSAPPDVLDDLQQAKGQWKNLRTVEPLVAKAPTGDISPALLQGRVLTQNKGTYGAAYGGGGDLKALSDIGQRFLKAPPSSGTAERLAAIGGITALGEAIPHALTSPSPLTTLAAPVAGLGAGLAVGRGLGSYLRSEGLANSVINRGLRRPPPQAWWNYLSGAAQPAIVRQGGLASYLPPQ